MCIRDRLYTAGFGRSQASKAVWTYRRGSVSDVEVQGHTLYSVTEERIKACLLYTSRCV